MTTQQLWMGVLTGSHRLFENDDHITLATKGVQPHSTSEELLTEFHELCSFNIPTFPISHDRIVLYERAHHPLAGTPHSALPIAAWEAAL